MLQWEREKLLRFRREALNRRKRRSFQRRCGLSFFLQVLIVDKDFRVTASLFSSGRHRQLAKFVYWKRISGRDLSWNEDSERVLSFIVNRQGIESGVRVKGPRRQEAKRLNTIPISKKTKKVFWAEWGPIFVVYQSRIHLLVQESEVKGSTLRGFVKRWEWKTWRYACIHLFSHLSILLSLLVVWHFLCRVILVQIFLVQFLFLSLLWKIE